MTYPGSLAWQADYAELVADPVAGALADWKRTAEIRVAPIDPELADTAPFCERYGVDIGRLGQLRGDRRQAAATPSATPPAWCWRRPAPTSTESCAGRLDVAQGVVRADGRRGRAVTGMEYGGITPVGLPADWPICWSTAPCSTGAMVVIGSGLRRSKIALPPDALAELPGAEVIDGLAG